MSGQLTHVITVFAYFVFVECLDPRVVPMAVAFLNLSNPKGNDQFLLDVRLSVIYWEVSYASYDCMVIRRCIHVYNMARESTR